MNYFLDILVHNGWAFSICVIISMWPIWQRRRELKPWVKILLPFWISITIHLLTWCLAIDRSYPDDVVTWVSDMVYDALAGLAAVAIYSVITKKQF